MSVQNGAIFDPEELSALGTIFDHAVASLPATMRTDANRAEIAKIVMRRAAAGEPELLPFMKFAVGAAS
jgi:superfamily II RNA helicase